MSRVADRNVSRRSFELSLDFGSPVETLSKLTRQEPWKAYGISHARELGSSSPVEDAFTARAWLVELIYARHRFIVSVKNLEAQTLADAAAIAAKRGSKAFLNIGNLIRSTVVTDSVDNRKRLGVSGPESNLHYENMRAA